jgi:hypothetical protein
MQESDIEFSALVGRGNILLIGAVEQAVIEVFNEYFIITCIFISKLFLDIGYPIIHHSGIEQYYWTQKPFVFFLIVLRLRYIFLLAQIRYLQLRDFIIK